MEKVKPEIIGNSNKANSIKNEQEQIKNNIIYILREKNLIFLLEEDEIKSIIDAKNYMGKLYKEKKINKDQYIEIGFNAGAIKLGDYMVMKGIIKDEDKKFALELQKIQKNNKSLGQILVEQEIITLDKLNEILNEVGLLKLGEYLIGKNIISQKELNTCLNNQKIIKRPLGEIIVANGYATQKQMNNIYHELKIELIASDLAIVYSDDEISITGANERVW